MNLRSGFKNLIRFLANKAIAKHEIKIVAVYGWDWSEMVVEAIYNVLAERVSVRRNTEWIKTDVSYPAFILGCRYNSTNTLERIWCITKAIFRLYFFSKSHPHYLVVGMHAKQIETLRYWMGIGPAMAVAILPLKNQISDNLKFSEKQKAKSGLKVIDLSKSSFSGGIFETTESITGRILNEIATIDSNFKVSASELKASVMKINWQELFVGRVRDNIDDNIRVTKQAEPPAE